MKQITHLKIEQVNDLDCIVNCICSEIKDSIYIVLFGCYLEQNYADYPLYKKPKCTLLVVTSGKFEKTAINTIFNRVTENYYKGKSKETSSSFLLFNVCLKEYLNELKEGKLFYTTIRKEGVTIYNKIGSLPEYRDLDYMYIMIHIQLEGFSYIESGLNYLNLANYAAKNKMISKVAYFLYMSCFCFLKCIVYANTLHRFYSGNLIKLFDIAKIFSIEIADIFPFNTKEEKLIFLKLIECKDGEFNTYFDIDEKILDILSRKIINLSEYTIGAYRKISNYYENLNQYNTA